VVFDAVQRVKGEPKGVLVVDTAGRLHTKVNLMKEMEKVGRILAREVPGAPHETLLVLDATTGQNGFLQARAFLEAVPVNGLVLTKLDGTAKGGIVVRIAREAGLPVRFVGVGEGLEDIAPFDPEAFVKALFE
jgi:fused signal recognition particle receptor